MARNSKRKVIFEKGTTYVKLASIQQDYRTSVASTKRVTIQRARKEGRWIDQDIKPARLVSGIYSWCNGR